MNIVVVGGGTKGKFGNDFVLKARADGHNVAIVSHRLNGDNDPQQFVADFRDVKNVVSVFKTATANFENIDIMLYVSNGDSFPCHPLHYSNTGLGLGYIESYQTLYDAAIKNHVIIPHILSIECCSKMLPDGKIVFMSSALAFDFANENQTVLSGYAGAKAFQVHLMKGLAHYNNRGLIVSSITTELLYNEPDAYRANLERLYTYIITHSRAYNGKIVSTDGRRPRLRLVNQRFADYFLKQVDVNLN